MAVSQAAPVWPLLGDTPLVTIVTPSFNQGEFLAATIESVLAQDYPQIEYLVMDAGSTDGTLALLRGYANRVRWVSRPDGGQADAINQGWRQGGGAVLAWLNADDVYMPGAVRGAVAALQAHPGAAGVYGDCDTIDQHGHTIGTHPTAPFDYVRLLRTALTPIPQPATFLRRAAVEQAGYLDDRLTMLLDLDLWLRLGATAPLRYIPARWACFREHAGSKTIARQAQAAPEVLAIYRRLFANPALPPAIAALEREATAGALVFAANSLFMAGQLRAARSYALRGMGQAAPRARVLALKILLIGAFGRSGLAAYLWGRHRARMLLRGRLRA